MNSISVPGPTRGLWLLAVLFCFFGSWASAQSPGSLIRPGDFPTGLKGWWKLDEASGTRMDSSGNGNHLGDASSVGSVAENYWSSSEASADFEFSDSDGLSRAVAGTGLDISGPSALLTLAAWVKIESHPTATRIVIAQADSAAHRGYALQVLNDGAIRLHINDQTSYTSASGLVQIGKWHHVAVTHDAVTDLAVFYLDGNVVGVAGNVSTEIIQSSEIFGVGREDTNNHFFDGLMKDAAVWSRVLSPMEVKSLASGIDVSTAYRPGHVSVAPTAWWKLNEVSSGTAAVTRADNAAVSHPLTDNNTVGSAGGYLEGVAATFGGNPSTEYLSTADHNDWDVGTGDFSFSIWVNMSSLSGNPTFMADGPISSGVVMSYLGATNQLYCYMMGAARTFAWTPSANTWYHVVLRRQSGQLSAYVDGKQIGTTLTSTENITGLTSGMWIGVDPTNQLSYMNGRLSDAAFWKGYALSAAEIKALATALPVQKSGIVSYWPLDEANGTRSDVIGTNHLTPVNGASSAQGVAGNSASFQRSSTQRLEIAHAAQTGLDAPSALSVFYWAKVASVTQQSVLGKWTPNQGYFIFLNESSVPLFDVDNTVWCVANTAAPTGAFHHGAHVFDGYQGHYFLNGGVDRHYAATANFAATTNTVPFSIGSASSATYPFDGQVDEVVIARRWFRDEEIKSLYLRGLNGMHAFSLPEEIVVEQPVSSSLTDGVSTVSFSSGMATAGQVKTFTIRNSGDLPLTGLSAAVSGANAADFVLNTAGMSAMLDAGQSTTFTITFTPGQLGSRAAALVINSSDTDEAEFNVQLAGTGLSSDPALSSITLSSGFLNQTFQSATTNYAFSLPPGTDSLTFTPVVSAAGAVITVNGASATSGAARSVRLGLGTNVVSVQVTAPDGVTARTYSFTGSLPRGSLVRPGNLPSGLAGWWKLEETTGNNRADFSGNNNHLTPINGPTRHAENYWSATEGSAQFSEAADQELRIGDAAQTGLGFSGANTQFTLAAWVKLAGYGAGYPAVIYKQDASGHTGYGMALFNGGFRLNINDNTYYDVSPTGQYAEVGRWHHVAVSFDSAANRAVYFRDGNVVGVRTDVTADPLVCTKPFRIGGEDNTVHYFDGQIHDAAVWSRVLAPHEVKSLASGLDMTTPYRPANVSVAPTAWWKLNELSSSTVAVQRLDSAGSHHLTDAGNLVGSSGGYLDGSAARFAGNPQYLSGPASSDYAFGTGDFTVTHWIKFNTIPAQPAWLGIGRAQVGNAHGITFSHYQSQLYIYYQGSPRAWNWIPAANTWYHVALRRSGTTLTAYIDGKSLGAQSSTENITNTDGIFMGRDSVQAAYPFDGTMQDVALWKGYALSDAEIKALATALPVQKAGIVSYWPLDEASGTRGDVIGTNHLTAVNAPGSANGLVSTAADFESSSLQYLKITNAAQSGLNPIQAISVFGWVKPESTGSIQVTAARGYANSGYGLSYRANGVGEFDTGPGAATSISTVSAGAWSFLGGVWDGGRKVYFNGAVESNGAGTGPSSTTHDFTLGANDLPGEYTDGLVDEVLIARRWFRDEEVKSLYLRGLAGAPAFSWLMAQLADGTGMDDGTGSVSFGNLTVETASTAQTVTITNTSSQIVTGLSVVKSGAHPGDFVVNTAGMSTSLAPGASTSFTVAFTPQLRAARNARIEVTSTSTGTANVFDFSVNGTGLAAPLVVASVSPSSARPGRSVVISGSGFSSIPGNNVVWFGSVKGTVTAGTTSQLTVTVPAGARYGPVTVSAFGLSSQTGAFFTPSYQGASGLSGSSFSTATTLNAGYMASLTAGDLDGDGMLDLVTANSTDSTITLFRNLLSPNPLNSTEAFAAGMFAPASTPGATVSTGGGWPYDVQLADVDSDGRLDIIAPLANGTDAVRIWRKSSTGGFYALDDAVNFTVASAPFSCAVADIDGDGLLDILTGHNGANFSVLRNTSKPGSIDSTSFAAAVSFATDGTSQVVSAGDLDGDGKPEVVMATSSGKVCIFRNQSSPGIINSGSFAPRIDITTGETMHGVRLGDLDHDGDLDLVTLDYYNNDGNEIPVLRNKHSGGTLSAASFDRADDLVGNGSDRTFFHLTDMDGDSRVDVAGTTGLNDAVVWPNQSPLTGQPAIAFGSRLAVTMGLQANGGACADFDGDGRPDIAGVRDNAGQLTLVRNIHAFGTPQIIVEQPVSTPLVDGAGVLSLGNITVGQTSAAMTVTIRNTGTADLENLALSLSGAQMAEFSLGTLPATILPPGATTTFTITFSPAGLGTRTAALQIANNAAGAANPFDLTLTGNGINGTLTTNFTSVSQTGLTTNGFAASGSTASLTLGYAPTPGTVLTLVNNTSANPISGTFTNLAQGQTVTLVYDTVSYKFNADYFGGNGNDLVLVLQGPGGLDYSFNNTGKTTTAIGGGNESGYAVAVQNDGKVVVAGVSHNGSNNDFAVARYHVDGTLDTSFNGTGKVVTQIGSGDDDCYDVVVQSDGKIVLAGFSHNGSNLDSALVRLNANGTLDTTFDGDGKLTVAAGSGDDQFANLALQSDGKIVVAGYVNGTGLDFSVARYNTNGTPDTSFNSTGRVAIDVNGGDDNTNDVLVLPDGKILVAGSVNGGPFGLVRLNADGTLDSSFGSSGKVITSAGSGHGVALALQSDGKILFGGYAGPGAANLLDFKVLRYLANGTLDTSFGSSGVVTTDFDSAQDSLGAIAVQSDGRIIVAGYSYIGAGFDASVARYDTSGSLDTSFYGTGKRGITIGAGNDVGQDMLLQADGKIIIAGSSHNGSNNDFAVVRLLGDADHAVTFSSVNNVPLNAAHFSGAGQTVSISLGFLPPAGTVLTLVNNTGALPIAAEFTNLANGQIVPLSFGGITYSFLASYTGGTGNDLTLTTLGGALDPTFNVTGKRLAAVSSTENDFANDVAIQPDGKIVSVGFTTSGNLRDFLVLRHNADGTPDASFGAGGVVTTSMVSGNDAAAAVAIQGDGKIVVVGQADLGGNNTEFALARYNTNGTLDTTFDGDGKLVIALASEQNLSDVVIQPDGKIVAAGYSKTSVEDMTLLRLNSNGSLDTTFDGDGMVSTSFGHTSVALSVFVMADGRILAGGGMSGANLLMARYQSNGALDTTFDTDGKVSVTLGGSDDFIRELAVDSAGRIVVSGESFNGSKRNVLVGRFTSSGALDTTFGGTGLITQSVTSGDDIGWAMSLQLDGKIVIGGTANYANGDFLLLRYLGSGTLDTGFGAGGILTAPIGSADDRGIGLAIQNDGKVVLVGASFDGNDYDVALARFQVESSYTAAFASASDVPLMAPSVTATGRTVNVTLGFAPTTGIVLTLLNNTGTLPISGTFTGLANGQLVPLTFGGITYNFLASYTGGTGNDLTLTALSGALDSGFGTTGKVVTTFGSNNDSIYAVATQQDGKIVAVGASGSFPETDMVLARYHPDGMLDTSFNGTGKITLALAQNDELHAVAVQNDGKIVAAGHSGSTSVYSVVVLRYNVDGTPDTGFNGNGRVTTAVGATGNYANGIIIQPDGRILVTGATQDGGGFFDFSLIRYLANGALDTSLNSTGKLTTSFGTHDSASSVTLQPDGKIVVAGYAWTGSEYDFAVARYQSSGVLDTTFDGDGKVTTAIGGARDSAFGVVVQPDGRIVVGGFSSNGTDDDAAIVRYNTDGTLDTSFNGDGKLTVAIGTGDDGARSISLQSDGKILAGGYATNSGNADFALLRILTNGSLDTSFGNGGQITTAIGSGSDKAFAMAVQVDGNVILAGSSFNGSNDDFAMARYTVETTSDAVFATETSVPLYTNGFAATGRTVNVTLNFAPSPGTELRLLNNTGAFPISGSFTNIAHGATMPLTYNSVTYNFIANYNGGTGNDLTLLLPGPGGLDYTFNGSGRVATVMSAAEYEELFGMMLQSDGRILLTSGAYNGANYDFGMARYLPNGLLDGSFGANGVVLAPIGGDNDFSAGVTVQADGKILVAGQAYNGSNPTYKAALARFQTNGIIDNSIGGFNGTGIVQTNLNGQDDRFYSVAMQADGRIVAAGRAHGVGGALMRFMPDGLVDASFNPGNGGKLMIAIEHPFTDFLKVAIQPDGRIVAVGSTASVDGPTSNFAILRCNANGTLDASFNSGSGTKTVDFNGSDYAEDVAFLPDGKILVAGSGNTLGNSTFALARLNADGTMDNTFGTGGKVTTDLSAGEDMCFGMEVQADGKIVLGGNSGGDFAVVRYLANGSLDTSFRDGGKAIFPMGAATDKVLDMAIQTDGKIVLSGYSFNGSSYDYALARLTVETTSDVTFASATTVPLNANGFTAAGRTLNVTLGFAPAVGTRLKVLNNTGLQPIGGEFVNLAHGQMVTLGYNSTNYTFTANYFGGDGNDLVLEWAYNRLVAWGNNGDGNLGANSAVSQFNLPVAVTAAPAIYGKHLLQVAAGNTHSLAVASDGSVAAWGYNGVGQLGNGGTTNTLTPVAVTFSGDLAGKKAVSVAAGWMHSLALFSDGTVAAWGHGGYGQLGNNSNFNSSTPVKVSTTGALAGKRVMAIAAGFNHSAALCSDGTVVCWGANDARQLGNGGTLNSAVPVAVVHAGVLAGKAVKAICAGYGHTLALCTDGSVAAWGANANQQLGNNSTVNSNVPVAVTSSGLLAGRQVVTVAAGGDTSMALCSDGTLVSWGHNDRGQIGSGSAVTSFGEPQAVDMTGALSGRTVTSIQMGFRHALALCDDGVLAAWGSNVYGQLGNNTVTDAYSPVLVSAGAVTATEKFTGISGGSYANHSLAVVGTTAPTPLIVVEQPVGTAISDGSSVAFGNTLVGTTRTRTFLIKNTGTATLSGIACSLAGSGAGFYSVIQAPAATVAPGDSTTFTVRFTPALPNGPKAATLNIANNVTAVNDINPFNIALSGVAQSSLTLSYATGAEVPATANGFSATGKTIVTNTSSLTHAPLAGAALMILDNTGPSFVTGTFTYNSQALTHGSTIQMSYGGLTYNFVVSYYGGDGNDIVLLWAGTRLLGWGPNNNGTLGNNTTTGTSAPTAVNTAGVLANKTLVAVAAGERHTLALCSDGTLAAWGDNSSGQLGDGTTVNRHLPVLVSTTAPSALNGRLVVAIAAGYDFSVALCSDGKVVTWGLNAAGQLGDGTYDSRPLPVLADTGAMSGKSATGITAGLDFCLARCSDGTAAGWGSNGIGQLGNGTDLDAAVPTAVNMTGVLSGKLVSSIAAGQYHMLALCTDGTLAAWGDNTFGELGINSINGSLVPVLVNTQGALSGKTPAVISCGQFHSLLQCTDGSLHSWGDNTSGQLGTTGLTESLLPINITTSGILAGKIIATSASGQSNSMVTLTDGSAAAWGDDALGQIGNGAAPGSALPVSVSSSLSAGERLIRVAAGPTAANGYAIVALPLVPPAGTPVVSTDNATAVGKTAATLNGQVLPNGTATSIYFEYGTSTSYGSSAPSIPHDAGSGSTSQPFSQSITGLEPNTIYYYRLKGLYGSSSSVVDPQGRSFTTLADPPLVSTSAASNIANNSVTLNGSVNPAGRSTTVTFEVSTSASDFSSPFRFEMSPISDPGLVPVTRNISGLPHGTTFYYRVHAENSAGASPPESMNVVSFTTTSVGIATQAPTVSSTTALNITTTSARLQGSVNPHGGITNVYFEHGPVPTYGTNSINYSAGSGTSPQNVFHDLTNLQPATQYQFRIVAENNFSNGTPGSGFTLGQQVTFTTLPLPPTAETQAAAALSTTSARLNGTVNAQNGSAVVTFEWGTDGVSFPNSLTATPSPVTGNAGTAVSVDITNLAQFTTYHFRVKAESTGGESTGGVLTFQPAIISGLDQQPPTAPPASNGSLMVTLTPTGILSGWRFVGEQRWRASGETATGLVLGSRLIEFRPVPGYLQPGRDTLNVAASGQEAGFEYYTTPSAGNGGILVVLKPDAVASLAVNESERGQWRLLGETAWRNSGTTASALPAGSYLIECKAVAGYSTPAQTNIVVASGQTVNPTIVYPDAFSLTGTLPVVQTFSSVSTDATKPYRFVGQLRSNSGLGTGFAVKSRVVATAAHVVVDEGTLSSVQGLQWLLQEHTGQHEPLPATPRGYYLIDGYAMQRGGETRGSFSLASRQKDVAALYFLNDIAAARTGYAGFLASDLTNNEFLVSSAQKMLVGYPIDGITPDDQGRLHATPAANWTFTGLTDRVFATTGIRSTGGNSGGPLCVQHTNGNWYPAAIYLGGATQSIVRAIDSQVIALFNNAQQSGIDDQGYNNGGATHSGYDGTTPTSVGAAVINITPTGSGWRPAGSTGAWTPSGNARAGLPAGTLYVEFIPVSGYQTPVNFSIDVVADASTPFSITFQQSQTLRETWRQSYFGSIENSGNGADGFDFDGDGFTNAQEYAAGTNPTLSGDFFKVSDSQRTASTFSVSTAGKAGRTYTLQRSTNLASWTNVISQGPLANDATVTLEDLAMPNDAAFYRIQVTGP